MKARIAVATVSGKHYYRLVNELKQRNLPFLSVVPGSPIQPSIKVVITTEREKNLIDHPNLLIYDDQKEATDMINEASRIVLSKVIGDEVTIGVDPGKNFGIAVINDGVVLGTFEELSLEKTVDIVFTELKKNPGKTQKVKIGSGVPELAKELSRRLHIALPPTVTVELVSEAGTSTVRNWGNRKKLSDADSAARIATGRGSPQPRRKSS